MKPVLQIKQIPLDIQFPAPFGFDDFLIGPNLEAFDCLQALAQRGVPELAVYLFGAAGIGKSHLLRATVAAAQAHGLSASYVDARAEVLDEFAAGVDLLAVDHADALSPEAQITLFGLYNAQKERGAALLCAGRHAPAAMDIREDLRTRLAWGLVFQIVSPADEDKTALLQHRAAVRGYQVGEEVCRYLVTHGERDLGSLTTVLDQLDRAAISAKRALTLPFAREVLKGGLD